MVILVVAFKLDDRREENLYSFFEKKYAFKINNIKI